MDELFTLFIAAVVGEGIVEYLLAPLFDKWKESADPALVEQCLRMAAAAVGIAIAWQLQLKFFEIAFGLHSLSPWFDITVTGIAIGRGANYINDLVGKLNGN